MATPNFMPGRRIKLLRSNDGTPTNVTFLAMVETKKFTQANQFAETTAPDENDPVAPPRRKSVKLSSQWDVSFGGMLDASKRSVLQGDCDSEDPVVYVFEFVPENGVGAGKQYGAIFFENLEIVGDTKGMVSFSVTARGDDVLNWADAA